ncbi:hypothetical protein H0H81_001073 [Sphagnurus paluster]|uniref:Uncharacterized protein n=1 Tax=Sphagnurus paluster TaxID=117069 RepID=A0A9P7GNG7_9AGAR|nr:hypothetical protein H0H81_001073 [Sphagnurus paluster]
MRAGFERRALNCIEGGLVDTCLQDPTPAQNPAQNPVQNLAENPAQTPAQPPAQPLAQPPASEQSISAQTVPLPCALPQILIPFLLLLPLYYASKAQDLCKNEPDRYLRDFDQWVDQQRLPSSTRSEPVGQPIQDNLSANTSCRDAADTASIARSSSAISLSPLPAPRPTRTSDIAEPRPQQLALSYDPSPPQTSAPPLPESIQNLNPAWLDYIQARIYEWRISFGISGFLTAPTIFQIQSASADPLPRTLAFLAVFHAIVGLLFTPAFLFYFSGSYTRSPQFSVLWLRGGALLRSLDANVHVARRLTRRARRR